MTHTALIPSSQIPLIEQFYDGWLIWIDYNRDKTAGTYLQLHPDGKIERKTVSPMGETTMTVTIKPTDYNYWLALGHNSQILKQINP